MPPISSTICWKCGKLARITHVIGTLDDRRHRVGLGAQVVAAGVVHDVRVDLGAARTLGVARDVDAWSPTSSAGFTPITCMASASPGSSGDCDGSSDARRCRARGEERLLRPAVVCARSPSFVDLEPHRARAGTGSPSTSQAAVTRRRRAARRAAVPRRTRAAVRGVDAVAVRRVTCAAPCRGGASSSWSWCDGRRRRGSRPRRYAVIFHVPPRRARA